MSIFKDHYGHESQRTHASWHIEETMYLDHPSSCRIQILQYL